MVVKQLPWPGLLTSNFGKVNIEVITAIKVDTFVMSKCILGKTLHWMILHGLQQCCFMYRVYILDWPVCSALCIRKRIG